MEFKTSFPAQHQNVQPGLEYEMNPMPVSNLPRYDFGTEMLKDKCALITGGDSGIGKAVAIAFAKQKANVAILYYNEDKDAHDTKNIVESYGVRCILIKGDISDSEFCKQSVELMIQSFGAIDILVNNSAVQYEKKDLKDIDDAQFDKTFKTNVYGAFYITKAALQYMKNGGSIINTTSVTAYKGNETLIDYSMTKGALVAFTRSLALSLAKKKTNIRVNAVAPGPIWTPLIPSSFDAVKTSMHGNSTPMGRAGQPVECAGAYVFLASESSSFITGETIHINGGDFLNN